MLFAIQPEQCSRNKDGQRPQEKWCEGKRKQGAQNQRQTWDEKPSAEVNDVQRYARRYR